MADMKTIQCRILTCAVRSTLPAFLDEHLIADHEYQSCNLCGSAQVIATCIGTSRPKNVGTGPERLNRVERLMQVCELKLIMVL